MVTINFNNWKETHKAATERKNSPISVKHIPLTSSEQKKIIVALKAWRDTLAEASDNKKNTPSERIMCNLEAGEIDELITKIDGGRR